MAIIMKVAHVDLYKNFNLVLKSHLESIKKVFGPEKSHAFLADIQRQDKEMLSSIQATISAQSDHLYGSFIKMT